MMATLSLMANAFFLVVRDINRSKAQLLLNASNLHAHLHAELSVQIGKRLIKKHQVGLDDHCAGKCHALLLPPLDFARIAVFKALQIDEPAASP